MRMIFRCDPALSDHLPRACSRAAGNGFPIGCGRLPAKAHSDNPPAGHSHREAVARPFGRRDGLWAFSILLPLRRHGRSEVRFRGAWNIPEPSTLRPSPRSLELSCRGAGFPDAPFARRRTDRRRSSSTAFGPSSLSRAGRCFCNPSRQPRTICHFARITGLVDADRFPRWRHHIFRASWIEPDFSGVLPKGTPVAQVLRSAARLRQKLEFECFD